MRFLVAFAIGFLQYATANSSRCPSLNGIEQCQGYAVSNVKSTARRLDADLDLIGDGCGIYGPDIAQLRLSVEYQTGKHPRRWLRIVTGAQTTVG
jgi:alpha-glucosidase